MGYPPQRWADDDPTTPVNASRLTHIESGIQSAASVADAAAETAGLASTVANSASATATAASSTASAASSAVASKEVLLTVTAQKTANYTATANQFVPFDTTSGALVLTLPSNPADGTKVGGRIDAGANTLTFTRAGSDTISSSGATTMSLSLTAESLILKYRSSDHVWVVIEHGYAKSAFVQPSDPLVAGDRPTDQGLCGWSVRLPEGASSSTALTSGTRYFVRVKCNDSRTLSIVYIGVSTAGSGLTSGQNLIGITNAAGTLIGTCPDQTTAWGTTGVKVATVTVVGGQSLAVTAGQFIYVQFLSVGTTPPNMSKSTGTIGWANANISTAPFRFNTGLTSQTTLTTSVTMSGLTVDQNAWAVAVA